MWPKMGSKLFNTFARLKYSKIKPILFKTQLNYHYPHYFRHLLPTIDYSKRQLQLLVLIDQGRAEEKSSYVLRANTQKDFRCDVIGVGAKGLCIGGY